MNILLDFDKTIAFRKGGWISALCEVLFNNGCLHISKDQITPHLQTGFPWHSPDIPHKDLFKGKTWWNFMEEKIKSVFKESGIKESEAQRSAGKVRHQYLDITYWAIYEDSIEFLEKMMSYKHDCYILSNHVPELEELTGNLGLKKYFNRIISSGNLGYEKPNALFYQKSIELLGIDKADSIMIGDSYMPDVYGAEQNGIKAILVRSENRENHIRYSKNLTGVIRYL